jgi:hypothetical protein
MESSILSTATAAAAALAAGAYLNAKLGIGTDVTDIRGGKIWMETFMRRMRELGDTCSLYGMFDRVDEKNDALWFEGRTWSYGELKLGVY